MTTDWIKPTMAEPKGLDFGKAPPSAAKPHADEPHGLQFKPGAPPAPRPSQNEPGGLAFKPVAPPPPRSEMLECHHIDGTVTQVPLYPSRPTAPRREVVVGGDPRAPAFVEKARAVNAKLTEHRLFRNRLEAFLDLKPTNWITWGDSDLRILTDAASKQAEFSRKLSLANAVQWCQETEQAYKKPPGFLDRLTAPKPEYYRERLEQARDTLSELGGKLAASLQDLKPRLENVTIDAFVLQIATAEVTAQADQITANRRLQTMVAGQQTAEMIVQGLETLSGTIANQAATVGDLLTVTIPNWIIARSKA